MRSTPSSSFILLTRHILAYWTPTKFCIRACFRKYLIKTYLYHLYVYCISGKTVVLPTVRCTTKKYNRRIFSGKMWCSTGGVEEFYQTVQKYCRKVQPSAQSTPTSRDNRLTDRQTIDSRWNCNVRVKICKFGKLQVICPIQFDCASLSIFRALSLASLLQLPGPAILTILSNLCTFSRYRNALNTKLFPPHTRSSSILLYVTFAISLPVATHAFVIRQPTCCTSSTIQINKG